MSHNPTLRVIKVLQLLSDSSNGLTLTELSNNSEIPFGTIQPIVKTLLNNKFLDYNYETSKYTIGASLYYIGLSFMGEDTTLDLIRHEMQSIATETGETVQMGILETNQVFYVLKVDGPSSIRVNSEIGTRLPAHATALGKAMLSGKEDEQIREIYKEADLVALTDKTITNIEDLLQRMNMIRENDYSKENGENTENISCIAVPIRQHNKIVAAVSVTYPTFKDNKKREKEIVEKLKKYRKNIETILLSHDLV